MNKTRIKVIKGKYDTLYLPQYKFLFWWVGISTEFSVGFYTCNSVEDAQIIIDRWLQKQADYKSQIEHEREKKRTTTITYIDYP